MSDEGLSGELEGLTHNARLKVVIDLGRRARAGDAASASKVEALRTSESAFDRALAVYAAHGDRAAEPLLSALTDRSRTVRQRAARLVPVLCDDRQAARALELLEGRRSKARLCASLARRGRKAAVDGFLAPLLSATVPDGSSVDLGPYGSTRLVESHLGVLLERGGPLAWGRLAERHPELASRALEPLASGSGPLDPRARWKLGVMLPILTRKAPDHTLALLRALWGRGYELAAMSASLGLLARSRPAATFDLLRAIHEGARPSGPPGAFGVAKFDRGAGRLGPERLAYLVEHAPSTLSDGASSRKWFLRLSEQDRSAVLEAWLRRGSTAWGGFLLGRLPPEGPRLAERTRAFHRWVTASKDGDGVIALWRLEALPRDLRALEARRHLDEVSALKSKPQRRVPYAALLPFDEARQAIASFLGHPEGEVRAMALSTLLRSITWDGPALEPALDLVHAKRFEQDPVRSAMIDALASLPLRRYPASLLPKVGEIVQDAFDAADLSHGTSAHLERLLVKLFRLDPGWGARWLAKLLEVRGQISTLGLVSGLTRGEIERLSPAIAELCERWSTNERASAVLWLARSFGDRLSLCAPLLGALERLAREQPFVHVAASALGELKAHDRRRFARLVPSLLAADPSYSLLPDVADFVSRKRQDLLTPLLEAKVMRGRFATGKSAWALVFGGGHGTWTPRQQSLHASHLAALFEDPKRDVPAVREAVGELVKLSFYPADRLIALASDPRPAVREIAVRALPWLDGGEGVPVLLACLADDRARWAIYALRKAFGEMARARVLAELRAAPTGKVTVAKEVIRLLGEMGGEDAFHDLLELDRRDLHRDVRIALLRALWAHLDRPETWAVLERASLSSDWVLAGRLADVPVSYLSAESDARLAVLLASILRRPEAEARLELLGRVAGLPLRDEKRALFAACVAHAGVEDPNEAALACRAALARMLPAEASYLAARLVDLVPRRRTLLALLPVVIGAQGPYAPAPARQVAEVLLSSLLADPHASPQALSLGAVLWSPGELAATLVDLSSRGLLHADALAAAYGCVSSCVNAEQLESALAEKDDPNLRRIALAALVKASGKHRGWSKERRERLERYRNDPSPLVAGAASFVLPP